MDKGNIPDRATSCIGGCIGDVCDTVGTQAACGGCCGCLERCAVKTVENQLRHPLVTAAAELRAGQLENRPRSVDDSEYDGQLGHAAAAYAYPADGDHHTYWQAPGGQEVELEILRTDLWPWSDADPHAPAFEPETTNPASEERTAENRGPRQRELVKAVVFLMAEWDRLERDRLGELSRERPVLVPRELCDGHQEIWWDGSGWYIRVWPIRGGENHGKWMARVLHDGGPYPAAVGATQRQAAAGALREVMKDELADQLAMNWPDELDVTADYLAQLAQEKLQQAPSRGYHPDQAVVEQVGDRCVIPNCVNSKPGYVHTLRGSCQNQDDL